jgi:DNA-binding NarL/FixJ family response regulator
MSRPESRTGPDLVRVVVVDDHEAVRAGLERLLTRASGLDLVAALPDQRDLLGLVDRQDVDVVILDYDLERSDGLTLCLRVKQRPDPPAVVVYSGYAGPGIELAAAAAAADALISKAAPVEELLRAVRRLARGDRRPEPPTHEMRELACSRLRTEDLSVMSMLLDRVRVADMAHALGLTEREALRRARRVVGVLQSAGRGDRSPDRVPGHLDVGSPSVG